MMYGATGRHTRGRWCPIFLAGFKEIAAKEAITNVDIPSKGRIRWHSQRFHRSMLERLSGEPPLRIEYNPKVNGLFANVPEIAHMLTMVVHNCKGSPVENPLRYSSRISSSSLSTKHATLNAFGPQAEGPKIGPSALRGRLPLDTAGIVS